MANLNVSVWYVDSAQWTAVAAWTALTSYTVGSLVRQLATPAVGSERVFVQSNPTTHVSGAAEPTWTTTRYGSTSDATCTWYECTGNPATNGDLTNAQTWAAQHASSTTVTAGLIIYDVTSASLQIVTTGGTIGGSVPTFSGTAGTTTADNTATWTSLGAASNFQYWKAPIARLQTNNVANFVSAGNTMYVGDDHAETQSAAMTITNGNNKGSLTYVYCVDHTANLPPSSNLKTAATVTTTGNSNMTLNGSFYFYGISFNCGTGANANNLTVSGNPIRMDSCSLNKLSTSAGGIICGGSNATGAELLNTTMQFANTGDGLSTGSGGYARWRNTPSAITGATVPSALWGNTNVNGGRVRLLGVDLSAITGNIFAANATNFELLLVNCRLNSGVASPSVTAQGTGTTIDLVNCDSGTAAYRHEHHTVWGDQTVSTTIYNNASDGVTPISWKVVSSASAVRWEPFECFEIVQWVGNGTYGNSTMAFTSATANITNAQVWIDVEAMGSASYPIANLTTSAPANFLTNGTVIGNGTWATGGLAGNYSIAIPSFIVNQAGYVRFTPKVGAATLTVYIDPAITVKA
jgi:hypothetical protein